VLRRNFFDDLEFNNDGVVTDKVCTIYLLQRLALVGKGKTFLCFEGNMPPVKLYGQTLLINRFQEATAHFTLNIKNRALNGVALLPE
jgi:hypothetical protein